MGGGDNQIKETIHVIKGENGFFKVHAQFTNKTVQVATVCPKNNAT